MNLILLAAQSSSALSELFPGRHAALLPVAGDALLSHAADLLAQAKPVRWFVTIGEFGAELETWLADQSWSAVATPIALAQPAGSLAALALSRDYLPGNEPLLMVPAGSVIKADWSMLQDKAVALLAGATVSALYVPRADLIWQAVTILLAQQTEPALTDLVAALQTSGLAVAAQPVVQWEDATTPAGLLRTNRRLLSVGYGSRDALERSFAEGFAVLPPIYLHETAEASSAVLGPYASIGAGAVIEDAVIRNSIIAPGARVARCVLDGAIVGESGQVTGRCHALHTGDNSQVSLG